MTTIALTIVQMSHHHAEAAAQIRVAAIRLAHNEGATWEQIGNAMGMSRQTAHKRFGHQIGDGWEPDGVGE